MWPYYNIPNLFVVVIEREREINYAVVGRSGVVVVMNTINSDPAFLSTQCVWDVTDVLRRMFSIVFILVLLKPWLQLRFDYDPTTTYRARLLSFDAIRREQKVNVNF